METVRHQVRRGSQGSDGGLLKGSHLGWAHGAAGGRHHAHPQGSWALTSEDRGAGQSRQQARVGEGVLVFWLFPPPAPLPRSISQVKVTAGWLGSACCHGKCTAWRGDGDSGLIIRHPAGGNFSQLTQRPSCGRKSPLVPKAPVCVGMVGGSGTAPSQHPLGTR